MKIPVVDKNDVEIGLKERDAIGPNDIYRVSALWLTNTKGEVLLAQRAFSKKNSPGVWGPAVAGTIEEGETYDSNIVKEIQEEIGVSVSIDQLHKGPKTFHKTEQRACFDQWYLYIADIPLQQFIVSEEEVAEIRWVNRLELEQWYAKHPEEFLNTTSQWLPTILSFASMAGESAR
jgi:isopentenyldiphosphate isomerase